MRRGLALVAVGVACIAGAVQAHAQVAITFGTPSVLSGATGFEPYVATDGQGNWIDSAPQGFPSGEGAYWISNDNRATWTGPVILGGQAGGGDEDDVYAPYDGSPYAGELYISDLAAADTTICYSMDHGHTFWAAGTGPNSPTNAPDPNACHAETAQGAAGPSNDRQWLTVDKGGRAYLSYHEFFSAQPVMFTTTDGGGDGFATPCGSPVNPASDPLLETYVPQDITGGTLISKPVVDAAGNIYELIATTTQQENGGAAMNSNVSGTYSELFLAVSTNHCLTFNDYTVFDGYGSNLPCASVPTCNTDQFGDDFNQIQIDSAGDLYATAAGFVGTTQFAQTTDIYLFSHKVSDPLGTWTGPTKLTNDGNGHMLPTLTPGPTPGQLAVGFFRTINNVPNPNDTSGQWAFSVLEDQNVFDSTQTWAAADVPGGSGASGTVYHLGDICNSGLLCGTGAPGTGTDRSLGDFTSALTDVDGCPVFSFAGNPGGASGPTNTYVAKQATACFAAPAANLPEVPLPGLLLGAGAVAIGAGVYRRRRATGFALS